MLIATGLIPAEHVSLATAPTPLLIARSRRVTRGRQEKNAFNQPSPPLIVVTNRTGQAKSFPKRLCSYRICKYPVFFLRKAVAPGSARRSLSYLQVSTR